MQGVSGKEQGGYLSLALATICKTLGIALPLSPIQGQVTSTPDGKDNSTVPLWGRDQSPLFRVVQLVRARANFVQPYPPCFQW